MKKFIVFLLLASGAVAQQINLETQVKGILRPVNGGTGLGIQADNTILLSNGASWVVASLPDCPDASGKHLNYSAHAVTCGTTSSGGGSGGAVSSVFGRTGTVVKVTGDYTAADVTNAVDTSSSYADPLWLTSLNAAKLTGTINASRLPVSGVTPASYTNANITVDNTGRILAAANGATGGGSTPTGPAGGDLSGTYPNPGVAKIAGVSVSGSPSVGQVIQATGPTAATWQTPASGGGGGGGAGFFNYQKQLSLVTGTGAPQDIYTTSVPSGTLSTGGAYGSCLWISYAVNQVTSVNNMQFNLTWGATTVTLASAIASDNTPAWWDIAICNDPGSTTSQQINVISAPTIANFLNIPVIFTAAENTASGSPITLKTNVTGGGSSNTMTPLFWIVSNQGASGGGGGGGGGGASAVSGLTDGQPVISSTTVITVGSYNCKVGNTVTALTGSAVLTISAGTGTAYVGCDKSVFPPTLKVYHNTLTMTCTGQSCNNVAGSAFGPDDEPIFTATAAGGVWTGVFDARSIVGGYRALYGLGLLSSTTNGSTAVSVDPTVFLQIVAAPSTSSSSCTPPQIAIATGFLYTCVGTNTWQRAATVTF